jgi:hypothetical protein
MTRPTRLSVLLFLKVRPVWCYRQIATKLHSVEMVNIFHKLEEAVIAAS